MTQIVTLEPPEDVRFDSKESFFGLSTSSPLQEKYRNIVLELPKCLKGNLRFEEVKHDSFDNILEDNNPEEIEEKKNKEILRRLFPLTYAKHYVKLSSNDEEDSSHQLTSTPLKVGVVLSGGQASGGHTVIAGLFDYLKYYNINSRLFGFIDGPQGIYTGKYIEVDKEMITRFTNQGGFHMLGSGRHKIETEQHKAASAKVCQDLELDGLVIIGGDDSNTNAAILSEYFLKNNCYTRIIGCPKTIDGDLRNFYVELSFGFDTAAKTYSEFIGNLCTDVATSRKHYHFVRLMGRSASHLTLECALQTLPNMTIIGEEIKHYKKTLEDVVDEIVDLVVKRHEKGRDYGVILLSEGLIEDFPDIGLLISELNSVIAHKNTFLSELSTSSRRVLEMLPKEIHDQLLLERDPHGNVQVAKIATEHLLIDLVKSKLNSLNLLSCFNPQAHYFGYEGRSALPTLFDATFSYSLGRTAAGLIINKFTGYMAVIRYLTKDVAEWEAGGCPLTKMMTIEMRKGVNVPVIKKYLVDMQGDLFRRFKEARDELKFEDHYISPGPIQLDKFVLNNTLIPPHEKGIIYQHFNDGKKHEEKLHNVSDLQRSRTHFKPKMFGNISDLRIFSVNSIQLQLCTSNYINFDCYAVFNEKNADFFGDLFVKNNFLSIKNQKLKVGLALIDQQSPGVLNVLTGLYNGLTPENSTVVCFNEETLLVGNEKVVTESHIEQLSNLGGFSIASKEPCVVEHESADEVIQIQKVCKDLCLDGLVFVGTRRALSLAYELNISNKKKNINTKVIGVPATPLNNVGSLFSKCTVGFDTVSRCYSQLVGNLIADAASARKYWYFVTLMGEDESHLVVETSLLTHPTITLISESFSEGETAFEEAVSVITNFVASRAENGKHFGVILLPQQLIKKFTQFSILFDAINTELRVLSASEADKLIHSEEKIEGVSEELMNKLPSSCTSALVKVSRLIRSCYNPFTRQVELSKLQVGELLSDQILSELQLRQAEKQIQKPINFNPLCFFLGYQARSSIPSPVDCNLGYTHGLLAATAMLADISGYVTAICPNHSKSVDSDDDQEHTTKLLVPLDVLCSRNGATTSNEYRQTPQYVDLEGKPYQTIQQYAPHWANKDLFCNPGPIQFSSLC